MTRQVRERSDNTNIDQVVALSLVVGTLTIRDMIYSTTWSGQYVTVPEALLIIGRAERLFCS